MQEKAAHLVAEFNQFNSWEDRYRLLIKFGKALPPLDEAMKQERFRIKGCQSQVWMVPELKDGKMLIHADSDAILVKGIAALFIYVYSDEDPLEIVSYSPSFLEQIGINEHLSMNRTNGLASMAQQLRLLAGAFGALKQKGVMNATL